MSPRRHWLDVALLAGMSLAAAGVASRFLDPGYPSAWDGGAHFLRLRAMAELFLPHGRTDGWCPWWFDGFVPFQFYPNLFFVVVAGLFHLLGGAVALLTLFKLAVIASWALLPPAVWILARAFRFSRYAALVAAGASLGLSAPQGIGIQGLFGIGLIPQAWGLVLFCLALAALHVAITVGGRHVPRAALWCAVVVCTHVISGAYLALAGLLYVGMALARRRWRRRRTLRRAAAVGALTAGMCAATLAPLVIWPELRGPGTGWPDHPFLSDFLAGRLFSGPIVTWLALAFVAGLRVRRFETAFLVTLALLTAPFAAGAITTGVPVVDDVARQLLRHRTLPYLALLIALFAGGACDVVRRAVGRLPMAACVVAAVLAVLVGWETAARVRSLAWIIQVDAHHTTTEKASFLTAFYWLRDNAEAPAVVGFDDRYDERFGQPGYTQLASRIVLEAERFTLLGNQPEATRAHNGEVLQHLHDWEPERIVAALRRYGVGYVVAWVDEVEENLARSPDLVLVYRAGAVRVWRVAGVGGFATGDGVHVDAFALAPERMVWLLRNDATAGAPVTLAVAWHPNWRAAVDGSPVPIAQTDDHLITLPVGSGPALLTLTWVRPWWNPVLNLISLATMLATLGCWARMLGRRSRRRS